MTNGVTYLLCSLASAGIGYLFYVEYAENKKQLQLLKYSNENSIRSEVKRVEEKVDVEKLKDLG